MKKTLDFMASSERGRKLLVSSLQTTQGRQALENALERRLEEGDYALVGLSIGNPVLKCGCNRDANYGIVWMTSEGVQKANLCSDCCDSIDDDNLLQVRLVSNELDSNI